MKFKTYGSNPDKPKFWMMDPPTQEMVDCVDVRLTMRFPSGQKLVTMTYVDTDLLSEKGILAILFADLLKMAEEELDKQNLDDLKKPYEWEEER